MTTNKLFVGSLPYSITDSQLQDHFLQCGTVLSAKVITDRYTGQSKGFGFVEMSTPQEAQDAIAKLNNSSLGGRSIIVGEARPQEKRENRNFGADNRNQRRDNRNYRTKKRRW